MFNPKSRGAYFAKMRAAKSMGASPIVPPESPAPKLSKSVNKLDTKKIQITPPGIITDPMKQKNKFFKLKNMFKPIKPAKV